VFSVLSALMVAPLRRMPKGMTIGLLRSRLTHDSSAIFGRLAALLAEWKQGHYHSSDPEDCRLLLADLEAIYSAHAAVAAGVHRSVWIYPIIVYRLARLRRALATIRRQQALDPGELNELGLRLDSLRAISQKFTDAVCRRHASPLADLVVSAASSIRREIGGGLVEGSASILLEGEPNAVHVWVPRADAARWHDLFRNLIRNAVEASVEGAAKHSGTDAGNGIPPVIVRLSAARVCRGLMVEIEDAGVGMTGPQLERIWTSGAGRHGAGRGQGLTESKHDFLRERAEFSFHSAIGMGTRVRIEVATRDIAVSIPSTWLQPPIVALAMGVTLAGVLLVGAHKAPASEVRIVLPDRVEGIDSEGGFLWGCNLDAEILENRPSAGGVGAPELGDRYRPAVLKDGRGRIRRILVSTQPTMGSGQLIILDGRGRKRGEHRLKWNPPLDESIGNLLAIWVAVIPWNDGRDEAIILHVRRNRDTPTSTQFFTPRGDSLGAYQHWGHLSLRTATDLDGDGRVEVLLFGVNNDARSDSTIFPEGTASLYIPCVVLLETPTIGGQAYPFTRWPDLKPAAEEAYLLIPPWEGFAEQAIREINIGAPRGEQGRPIEVVMADGRRYFLDAHLRPESCQVGELTAAFNDIRNSGRTAIEPVGPLVYFTHGSRSDVRMPVPSPPGTDGASLVRNPSARGGAGAAAISTTRNQHSEPR
jgi:signal transduction histidine kinase